MKREKIKIGCDGFTNAWYSESRLFRVIDAKGLGFFSRYRYLIQFYDSELESWYLCRSYPFGYLPYFHGAMRLCDAVALMNDFDNGGYKNV